ncbi:unnamed protein product [Strongylus vulgaris]|uniref:Uncharacterized protein n=1 Tax=Strongylus vulgaris TaxID=40348 RepID=A0A3P7J296_STRVU|nr:unnamed protein product [Strongylus vulgaris]
MNPGIVTIRVEFIGEQTPSHQEETRDEDDGDERGIVTIRVELIGEQIPSHQEETRDEDDGDERGMRFNT